VALKNDGTVWAWGNNGSGQLGNGTFTTQSTAPVQVSGLAEITAVAAGSAHTVALKNDGTVWACGDNSYGQLGNVNTIYSATPVPVSGITGVSSVAAGSAHTVALKSDGTAWTWGVNTFGQLGNGTNAVSSTPVSVSGLTGGGAVAAGSAHTVALKSDGTVWTWGVNTFGQLGNGTTTQSTIPVQVLQVSGFAGAASVAAGGYHSVAVKLSDGTVWAWGNNSKGQLGNGTTTGSPTPVQVSQVSGLAGVFTGVTTVAAGGYHSVARKSDGTVWAWGFNFYGQLGNGTYGNNASSSTPVQVLLTGVTSVAAGFNHTVALKDDGTVWAWGDNGYGQLGTGSTTQSLIPVQVTGLTGVIAVATGYNHTVALKDDGTVWAWGDNGYGQLGTGSTTQSTIPVQVTGLTGTFIAIAAGVGHTVALKSDKTVWTWGNNGSGQLGVGWTQIQSLINLDVPQFTVTSSAGSGGNINPPTPQAIYYNATTSFTVTASSGYDIASVTGCGGSLSGNTYTTGPITADCTVTASFNVIPYVRILETLVSYGLLQPAYDAAATGAHIQAQGVTLVGDLLLDKGKSVTIEGGYDSSSFTSQTGYTTLQGILTLKTGSLVVDHVVIKP
jgi:alpha-tubulin suppressor-like RCC1 family protein